MSILGRLMGTAESATRGAARGRATSRPGRTRPRPVGRAGSRGRAPAPSAGLGRMVENFLRRR